jgi:hypothetical protein
MVPHERMPDAAGAPATCPSRRGAPEDPLSQGAAPSGQVQVSTPNRAFAGQNLTTPVTSPMAPTA